MDSAELTVGETVLEVRDLTVRFGAADSAVAGVDLDLAAGRILGVAGQSGSGKSLTALAAMGLAPVNARIDGSIKFRGEELLGKSAKQMAHVRGSGMTMIFQETITALNPVVQIGKQMKYA